MNFLQSLFRSCRVFVTRTFPELSNQAFEQPELCLSGSFHQVKNTAQDSRSLLEDIIDQGFLWAAPKRRRSLEVRMTRRMGITKMIKPRTNLIVCDACGDFHPVHAICRNCYEKVKKETTFLQDAAMKELKLDPIDQEIMFVYEGDNQENMKSGGRRIVELPKERPQWFSKNLLIKDSGFRRRTDTKVKDSAFVPEIKEL